MEQDLDLLLAKYFSEEASQEEQTLAEGWISAHPEEAEVLKEAWQTSQQPRFEPNVDIAWAKVAPQIKEQATPEKISQKTSEKTLQKTKLLKTLQNAKEVRDIKPISEGITCTVKCTGCSVILIKCSVKYARHCC